MRHAPKAFLSTISFTTIMTAMKTACAHAAARVEHRPLTLACLRRIAVALLLAAVPLLARAEGLRVGEVAAPLDIELTDGKILRARELEGKVVLHYFWATWCPVCQQDLGKLQKIYQAFHSRGFEIIAHSLDDDAGGVNEFWRERGYTFPVAMRSNGVRALFGPIRGTPTVFLTDRKGTLRLIRLGALPGDELEARIAGLL